MSKKVFLLFTIAVVAAWTGNVLANQISGTVVASTGGGLQNVTITATGGTQTSTSYTNASGNFTANHVTGTKVTVTPTMTGYTFSPVNKTYNITSQNPTGCNFTGTLLTYTISGTVTGLDGVTMSGLPGSPVTSGGGNYTATVGYGWNGTVTPSKTGYSFNPTNKVYSNVTSNQTGQNYTPTLTSYTISGMVGTLDGVVMNGLPGNPSTSGGGNYSATVAAGWTGTVTPTKSPSGFIPSQMTYTNVSANQTAQNYSVIPDANLLGRWNFDDGTANDVSGYGHNGTLVGNATIVSDPEKGNVVSLDGNGDYVQLGNGSWTNPGNHMTLTAWIKVNTFNVSYQTAVAKGLYTYRLSRNSATSSMCTYMNYSGSNYSHIDGNTGVNNGAWHYVATSYDGTTIRLYVDNHIQDSGTLSTLYTGTANLCIGRNSDNTSRDWYGWIDDVRLYKKCLSDTEIEALAGTNYTISGTVGTMDGVTMSGLPGSPTTSGDGNYSATVAYGWDGTVTPTKSGYTFSPASVTYNSVISNQTQNYTPTVPTCTISGTIGSLDGVVMGGFPVETISTAGSYSATVTSGWTGTITPTKDGYTFSPTNKTYASVSSNQTSQNYTPALVTYTISGHTGTMDGVTMSGLPGNPTTSGGGAYSATVTCTWNGTVTPAKTGYTFSPSYRQYTNVTSNLTEDYTPIINTYTISGQLGITEVTMSGLPGDPVLTSPDGTYSATVNYGWTGTVTPTKSLYTFSPSSRTYSSVAANQANQDYTYSSSLGDPNLVGWWPFNGDALDYSGYGHNGTVTGAAYVTSDIGTVLQFNGVDYVSIPTSTFATIHDKVTIALWANGDAALQPEASTVFCGTNSSAQRVLNIHIPWADSMIDWDAGYAGGAYDRVNKSGTSNQYEGQWNHWVFTKDLSVEQMKIYLNGVLWASGTAKSKPMTGITQAKIGSWADGTYSYDGMLCEIKVYDKVMTAADVNALYNASYEMTNPSPANNAKDVAVTADLSWTKGYLAADTAGHKVYFGTDPGLVTSRDASIYKGAINNATYDPGTLANGATYYWAVDEVNDYYANSPWKGDVYSFTTVGTGQVCPICHQPGICDLNVQCYNTRLDRISGVQNLNLVQVTMDGHTSPSLAMLQTATGWFIDFIDKASFGRLKLKVAHARSYHAPVGSLSATKNSAMAFARTLGGNPLITEVVLPRGLQSNSNSGGGYTWLAGSVTSLDHESGHMLGLAHSGVYMSDGSYDQYKDSSSKMGAYPSMNYAVNQQHWLGWWKDNPGLAVNITSCLSKTNYIDVPLRPVGGGGNAGDVPYAYVYEIPNSSARIWIAIPKAVDNTTNDIQGGEIFVYRNNNGNGCTGICMNSSRIGRIGNPKSVTPHVFSGLTIEPISYQSTITQFQGHNVDNYSQITLRLSITGNIDDNDNNEPIQQVPVANWEFAENSGTTLRSTINDGNSGPATWTADVAGVTTTGNDTLSFAPTTNTMNGSTTYFDLSAANKAFTSGKVWLVMEVNDFNFAGSTVGERLRLGMVSAITNPNITAEMQIRRSASNSIQLIGYTTGTLPNTGVQICSSNSFSGLIEIAMAFDFDARTYQIFYRLNSSGDWNSIGDAVALNGSYMGNALRLCAGETATTGNGSWKDTGEYFHIGRIYLTQYDPTIIPPNVPPVVSVTYPNDGDTFTHGTNISLQAIAQDSDGNVSSVQFYNGASLLGTATPPATQNEIVNLASAATLHGSTIKYSGGCINTWTNMNDWVSWTANIARTGTFEVLVNYACKNTYAGSTYRVQVADQIVQGTVTSTGTDWSTYQVADLGSIYLGQTGTVDVNVVPETMPNGAVMNLADVTLEPVDLDNLYIYNWSSVPAGSYTITANATDDANAVTTSDPISITVN